MQIVEMILSMAGNNAINRWKEGAGVPQGGLGRGRGKEPNEPKTSPEKHTYVTPTSDAFKNKVTKVAPIDIVPKPGSQTAPTLFQRPSLESRAETEKALQAARKRTPRLPLVDETKAREILGEGAPKGQLPQWILLLANFATQGKSRIASQLSTEEGKWDLTPLMKAQAAWIIARQDRAWYALGRAKAWLRDLGQTDDQIYKLDGDWSEFSPAERSLFTVAKKLAASPIVLTDAEVAEALKLTGPKEVVQMISYTTTCASFNRITEAAGLRIEK